MSFVKKKRIITLIILLFMFVLSIPTLGEHSFKYHISGGTKIQFSPKGLVDYWERGYPSLTIGISKKVFLNCNLQVNFSYTKFKYLGWDSALVSDIPAFHGFKTEEGGDFELYGLSTNIRWKYGEPNHFARLSIISGLTLFVPTFDDIYVEFYSTKFDYDYYARQISYLEDRLNEKTHDIISTDVAINIGPRLDLKITNFLRLIFEFRYNVTLRQSEAIQFAVFHAGIMIDPKGDG